MRLLCSAQAALITEYAAVVQPIQVAFQQQIQSLKTQHEEFVSSLKQSQSAAVAQLAPAAEPEKPPPITTAAGERVRARTLHLSPLNVLVLPAGDMKPPMPGPPPGDFDGGLPRPQDPGNPSGPSEIPPGKPAWFDHQQVGPWNPNQPVKSFSPLLLCACTGQRSGLFSLLSPPSTRTSRHLRALPGTVMRACGMTRETRATGAEDLPEKEASGVAPADPTQAPHLGEGPGRLTSSLRGAASLSSLLGASGSRRFLHACRHVFVFFQKKDRCPCNGSDQPVSLLQEGGAVG